MEEELDIETAFNTLVQLARNTKLTWKEHQHVETAIRTVLGVLNKSSGRENKEIRETVKEKASEKEEREKD